jgi:hypothetical protein
MNFDWNNKNDKYLRKDYNDPVVDKSHDRRKGG